MKNIISPSIAEKLLIFLAAIPLLIALALLVSVPFYYLWNWLMPEAFGLPELTYWQSVGMLILAQFLTKSAK